MVWFSHQYKIINVSFQFTLLFSKDEQSTWTYFLGNLSIFYSGGCVYTKEILFCIFHKMLFSQFQLIIVGNPKYFNWLFFSPLNVFDNMLQPEPDIIVFPEMGLKGYGNQEQYMFIPDPHDKVRPCASNTTYEAVSIHSFK